MSDQGKGLMPFFLIQLIFPVSQAKKFICKSDELFCQRRNILLKISVFSFTTFTGISELYDALFCM